MTDKTLVERLRSMADDIDKMAASGRPNAFAHRVSDDICWSTVSNQLRDASVEIERLEQERDEYKKELHHLKVDDARAFDAFWREKKVLIADRAALLEVARAAKPITLSLCGPVASQYIAAKDRAIDALPDHLKKELETAQ